MFEILKFYSIYSILTGQIFTLIILVCAIIYQVMMLIIHNVFNIISSHKSRIRLIKEINLLLEWKETSVLIVTIYACLSIVKLWFAFEVPEFEISNDFDKYSL